MKKLLTSPTPDSFENGDDIAAGQTGNQPTVLIRPQRGWVRPRLDELWQYRELLFFLAWRDVKVRYKQTALGAAWAILQPVLTMIVFTVIFGHFANIPSDGVPYPVFSLAALLPWTLFAYAMTQAGNSLVNNANLISKIYFPRLIVPIAASLSGVLDFAIAFVVLLILMPFYSVIPTYAVFTLPLFLLLAMSAALSVGIWLSALNVEYRDVRYAIPFLTQIWLYATPVVYPASLIHGKLHLLLALNPMSGVVEGFRWALLGERGLDVMSLSVSVCATALCLVTGILYFARMERRFADVV